MNNNILSLKNIYNLLVRKDYPIECGSVINAEQKKGMTLNRFWKENLLSQLMEGRYGTNIWKNAGTRNRHTSEICNRSSQLLIYEEYTQEIVALLNVEFLVRQIVQFMFFLRKHDFSYKIFVEKLKAYLQILAKEDPLWNHEIEVFFEENADDLEEMESFGKTGREFAAGYFLTFLTLHALTGECMQSKSMCMVREAPQYAIKGLWKRFFHRNEEKDVMFLTARDSEIYGEVLPPENFYGREKELFDLREMLTKGGHYLLSGMGGIGKTELVQQFLRYCVNNKKVDYICLVPYENGFAESLLRAFSQKQDGSFKDSFKEIIGELKQYASRRKVLIILDDVTKTLQEDEELAILKEVPATVFLTSRLTAIDGFETYPVKELSKESCELIFRDSYKRLLREEEIEELQVLLNDRICRHTLTIHWLGQAAHAMNWSVEELLQKLTEKEESILWKEKKRHVSLKDMYLQLYTKTGLHVREKAFLEIMAFLPGRKYPVSFLYTYLGCFMEENKLGFLERLCSRGWLQQSEEGISMHPVIAESISANCIPEEHVQMIFKETEKRWKKSFAPLTNPDDWKAACDFKDGNFIKSAEMVMDLFSRIPEDVADKLEKYYPLVILSADIVKNHFSISPSRAKRIRKIATETHRLPDCVRIHAYLIAADYMNTDIEILKEEINRQDSNPTVSAELRGELYNLAIVNLVTVGDFREAEKLIERMAPVTIRDRVYYYMNRSLISGMEMKIEDSYKWNKLGIETAEENREQFATELFQLWGSQTVLCHGTKRMDEAEKCLREMKKYLRKDNVQDTWYYNFEQGTFLVQNNQVEEGIAFLKTAIEYAGYYFGRDHLNYVMECEELALGQGKLKLFEEAEENHKIALEFMEAHSGYLTEKCRILNNMGHMYLEWEKTDKAYECLREAYEPCRDKDDLSMAEPAYNLSRLYKVRGDAEQEMFYLKKAYPVFERIYSDRCEKTINVRKRMEELSRC